jgi:hypothetical protein
MKSIRVHILAASLPLALLACSDSPSNGTTDAVDDVAEDSGINPFGPDSESDAIATTDGSGDSDVDATQDTGGGEIGDPCSDDSDCESDLCLPLGGGAGVCSDLCVGDDTCPDGFECTIWENLGEDLVTICVPTDYCFDPDGDLYGDGPGCRGPDCVENAEEINAGAPEICDGVDNDCDGQVDDQADGTLVNCDTGFSGICAAGRTQCIDGSLICSAFDVPTDEVCNNLDDDCDGVVDNNPTGATLWYADVDNDRFGDESTGVAACSRPPGTIADAGDCDDNAQAVNPTVPESCDSIDNDCDGDVDEAGALGERTFYLDEDGDGFGVTEMSVVGCTAPEGYVALDNDCNDDDDTINPDAAEICDDVDNDCNGTVDDGSGPEAGLWYLDFDGDTYGDGTDVVYDCTAVPGRVNRAGDCDDNNRDVNPGQSELCNGIDDNCVGGIDEGALLTFYADTDIDGRGDPLVSETGCSPSAGYVANSNDCNDEEPAAWTGRAEVCDGIDNNCNSQTDEGVTATFYRDNDTDGRGDPAISRVACVAPAGFVNNAGDCNDEEIAAWTGRAEICDSIDNNCNSQIDEGAGTVYYADTDEDTYGDPGNSRIACSAPAGFVANNTDCDDSTNLRYPGRVETCDLIDNNCNTTVDEGVTTTYYRDQDSDTYGIASDSRQACTQPAGYVTNSGDCNDMQSEAWTGRAEICDSIDNNCNGSTDEGVTITYYRDQDNDTYGNAANSIQACSQPAGYVANSGDCNDSQSAAWTGRAEICDSIDNNCNGSTDEGVSTTYYRDEDNDTYGDVAAPIQACSRPAGYVTNTGDCNDKQPAAWTGRTEICDNIDNNCNSQIDEGAGTTYYQDVDLDTWGGAPVVACSQPPGTVTRGGDCNDNINTINPGRNELCSTPYDDNCNNQINESSASDARIWYFDEDRDGQGAFIPIVFPPPAVRACTQPADFRICFLFFCSDPIPYVNDSRDCDDSTARARVGGGPEVCDGYDNDCNGTRDDGFTRNLTYCRDRDDDGNGDPSTRITVCAYPVDASAGDWVVPCTDTNDND